MELDPVFLLTYLGDAALWVVIALNMYWKGWGKRSLTLFTFLILDIYLNDILKETFRIPRPSTGPTGLGPYGFPSGHAETVTLATTYIALTNPRYAPIIALIPLVSYTRVALGVHTVLDVAGGFLVGLGMAVLAKLVEARLDGGLMGDRRSSLLFMALALLTLAFYPYRTLLLGGFLLGVSLALALGIRVDVNIRLKWIALLNMIILILLAAYGFFQMDVVKLLLALGAGLVSFWLPKILAR